MTRRYGLRDDPWARMADLLPGRGGHVGGTARDNRCFVEAVLYRYRAGIPWRALPERFGGWKCTHTRYRRWARSGVWERVCAALSADADTEYAMIDATIVRAHQPSAGARQGGATRPSGGAAAACARRARPPWTRWATRPASPSPAGRLRT